MKPSLACGLWVKGRQQLPGDGGRKPDYKRQGDKSSQLTLNDLSGINL